MIDLDNSNESDWRAIVAMGLLAVAVVAATVAGISMLPGAPFSATAANDSPTNPKDRKSVV